MKVTSIIIEKENGELIELSFDEAKGLYNALRELFWEKDTEIEEEKTRGNWNLPWRTSAIPYWDLRDSITYKYDDLKPVSRTRLVDSYKNLLDKTEKMC